MQASKLKSYCLCSSTIPWGSVSERRMAPGSCSTTRCLPPLLHFPSSTFKSSCNLRANLPASAPLSSKLLPGSSQIRDRSISEPIFPAGSRAGCVRPRQVAQPEIQQLLLPPFTRARTLPTGPEQSSPPQLCPSRS